MSMFKIFDIAGSALSAQSLRLNVTASNLANANSVSSSTGETYRARHPIFAPLLHGQMEDDRYSVEVKVEGIIESDAPLQQQHSPDHPLADKDGYIYLPNVNSVEELANMISASRSYQSNVEIMNTVKQLALRTITLGQ